MKLTFCIFVATAFYFCSVSCSKSKAVNGGGTSIDSTTRNQQDSAANILGKWLLINDSIQNLNGFYFSGGVPLSGDYIGSPNDYFDFQNGGALNVFIEGTLVKMSYSLLPNNILSIVGGDGPLLDSSRIIKFTVDSLSFVGTARSANGGQEISTINLKR